LKTIEKDAFNELKKLTKINLPEGLETIGDHAFKDTNLKTVSIPSTVTNIGKDAFAGTDIPYIVVPDNATADASGAGTLVFHQNLTQEDVTKASEWKDVSANILVIPPEVTGIHEDVSEVSNTVTHIVFPTDAWIKTTSSLQKVSKPKV